MAADRREAIEELFVQYGRGVGSYLLARLGDAELAEEITARVFLAVVRHYGRCRGSVVGWLWSIVRSELARHYRDRRRVAHLDDDLADPAPTPPEEAARRETQQCLQEALARLSEREQEILGMKFFLRVRNKEIAEATGQSESNVGVIVHRALKKLHAMMEPGN